LVLEFEQLLDSRVELFCLDLLRLEEHAILFRAFLQLVVQGIFSRGQLPDGLHVDAAFLH